MTTPPDPKPGQYPQGSYPPPGSTPPPSQPQSGYGQPPAGYGPPPAGYGQPYGSPAPYGSPTGARPGSLTAAAVLAFVSGGLGIIAGLIGFQYVSLIGGFYSVVIIAGLVLSAALIFAGIQALNGKDTKLLTILAGAAIVLRLITIIWAMSIVSGAVGAADFIGFAIPILIIVFTQKPEVKAWVRAKGGTTL